MNERLEQVTPAANELEPRVLLLVADSDSLERSRLVSGIRMTVGEIDVLEVEDGSEAVQIGLQHAPAVALLDVDLPRLGGIEAAATLRELRPQMRVALLAGDPLRHRERSHGHQLPLFSKGKLGHTLAWLKAQIAWCVETQSLSVEPGKLNLTCTECGYGVVRSRPPDRCPMCQAESAWIVSTSQVSTPALARA